jgi:DNA-binding MarR family transcriptional regulator
MITTLVDESRRPDAAPWGPVSGFRDGKGQFLGPKLVGGLPASGARYGIRPSKATADAKPGLTRRGVIYEYVRAHPGGHVRAMARGLRLATGDLQYHLSWLEREGFVKTRKSGFYRFVFPTMVFSEEQEALLATLSQRTPREILMRLVCDPSMTQGELARSLGYSQPTVSWHMDRLVALGMVSKTRTGRGNVYAVVADRADILNFVKSYHAEVWGTWAGRLDERSEISGARLVERGARLMPPAVVGLIAKR